MLLGWLGPVFRIWTGMWLLMQMVWYGRQRSWVLRVRSRGCCMHSSAGWRSAGEAVEVVSSFPVVMSNISLTATRIPGPPSTLAVVGPVVSAWRMGWRAAQVSCVNMILVALPAAGLSMMMGMMCMGNSIVRRLVRNLLLRLRELGVL